MELFFNKQMRGRSQPTSRATIIFAINWNFDQNFFSWKILLGKNSSLGNYGSIFCPKIGLRCSKTSFSSYSKDWNKRTVWNKRTGGKILKKE